tara:strand:- start:836 stop:1363 length:528 start_codon:yes stop_codon:yes gene_type:complete
MSWILDVLASVYIIFLGYNGFNRGFIEEVGQLIGLTLAIAISISWASDLSIKLSEMFAIDNWLPNLLAFTFLFIASLLVARLFTLMLNISLVSSGNKLVNKILGFVFGSLKGLVVFTVFIWLIDLLPLDKWSYYIQKNSKLARHSTNYRKNVVSFFSWEESISIGESYIKEKTQP